MVLAWAKFDEIRDKFVVEKVFEVLGRMSKSKIVEMDNYDQSLVFIRWSDEGREDDCVYESLMGEHILAGGRAEALALREITVGSELDVEEALERLVLVVGNDLCFVYNSSDTEKDMLQEDVETLHLKHLKWKVQKQMKKRFEEDEKMKEKYYKSLALKTLQELKEAIAEELRETEKENLYASGEEWSELTGKVRGLEFALELVQVKMEDCKVE